ncbi:MAG: o-succinylbenzoate synthase [Azonexus sp.]
MTIVAPQGHFLRREASPPAGRGAADWLPYCLPLKRPWQTSRGSISERHGKLYRLQTDDGLTGWGDCAPLPEFGIDEAAARDYAEECARLDLAAQRAGLPLGAWLACSPPMTSVAVNAVLGAISTVTPDAVHDSLAEGYRILKIKVGDGPLTEEIERLQMLCTTLPAGVALRLDANTAWSAADAERFLAACLALPIDGIEEPLRTPDIATLQRLQTMVPFPLAIDESTQLVTCEFWQAPPVRRLVIKPARHGGLLSSVELGLRAQAAGLECIVTASLESACGVLACAHLAAAIAPEACHGLATAYWLASDTGQAPVIRDARMMLPQTPGLGFALHPA